MATPGNILTKMTFTTVHEKSTHLVTHRHQLAYVSLVLDGHYSEQSVDGRFIVKTGSVVYHPPHHLHANTFECSSARVLNLRLRLEQGVQYSVAHVPHLKRWLERLMREHAPNLATLLEEILHDRVSQPASMPRWIDELGELLRDHTHRESISDGCRRLGVSPEHASREYRRNFGVSPQRFRREYRLRYACRALAAGTPPSVAAQQAGFADQSHLGRVMKSAIGQTPAKYMSLFL